MGKVYSRDCFCYLCKRWEENEIHHIIFGGMKSSFGVSESLSFSEHMRPNRLPVFRPIPAGLF